MQIQKRLGGSVHFLSLQFVLLLEKNYNTYLIDDAWWNQIARDQVEILKDPVGTELAATDYHKAVEALGGVGYFIDAEDQIADVLTRAKESCLDGKPVVVNVRIAKIDFRKGSISM